MRRYAYHHPPTAARNQQPFFSLPKKTVQTKEDTVPFFQTQPATHDSLTIGQPGDAYEQQADAMANAVVGGSTRQLAVQRKAITGIQRSAPEEEKLQTRIQRQEEEEPDGVQRMEEEEEIPGVQRQEEEEEIAPKIQAKTKEGGSATARPGLASQLAGSQGKGNALPSHTRQEMQSAFGANFEQVRIHTNQEAVQMNQQLHAQAFTYGNHIYFNQSKFNPDSPTGKHLLAHELTHTIQQQGTLQRQPEDISPQNEANKAEEDAAFLPGYTQCDFLDEHISFEAQYALYHLYKRGGTNRGDAVSMLGAVKNNQMQGIYKEDQGKPALMARRHGTFWWQLIPKGQGALVFEPEIPPMMVFKNNIANNRAALADALLAAWEASSLGSQAIIIPPPSLQPCPISITLPPDEIIVFPPDKIEGKQPPPPKQKKQPETCDKEKLAVLVDQCIEKAKIETYKCHAFLKFPAGWKGVGDLTKYYFCLKKVEKSLLECDRKAKQITNCQ